jgi:hypothetical protein
MRFTRRSKPPIPDSRDAEFQIAMQRPDLTPKAHTEQPGMSAGEFLERIKSATFSYNMAVAQLRKIDDQSDAQIAGAKKRRDDAERHLREIAKEFVGG